MPSAVSGSLWSTASPVVRWLIASRLAERATALSPARCQYPTALAASAASVKWCASSSGWVAAMSGNCASSTCAIRWWISRRVLLSNDA